MVHGRADVTTNVRETRSYMWTKSAMLFTSCPKLLFVTQATQIIETKIKKQESRVIIYLLSADSSGKQTIILPSHTMYLQFGPHRKTFHLPPQKAYRPSSRDKKQTREHTVDYATRRCSDARPMRQSDKVFSFLKSSKEKKCIPVEFLSFLHEYMHVLISKIKMI